MRFERKETVQDVVVSCCILYNMRKLAKQETRQYDQQEFQQQIDIGQNVLNALAVHNINRQVFRIQNFLIEQHF